jgi:hypothetical protein
MHPRSTSEASARLNSAKNTVAICSTAARPNTGATHSVDSRGESAHELP